MAKIESPECFPEFFVNKRFKNAVDDEWPIWGPIQREANHHFKKNDIISSDKELIDFLRMFFSVEVLQNIQRNLEVTANSWLGPQYSKRGNFSSYVENLIASIVEQIEEGEGGNGDGKDSGGSVVASSGHKGKSLADDTGGWTTPGKRKKQEKKEKSKNEAQGRDDTRLIGGGGEDEGDKSGGRNRGASYFFLAQTLKIILSPWTTPEKLYNATELQRKGRTVTIRERSQKFISDSLVANFLELEYDPGIRSSLQEDVYLYHGTRSKNIQSFRAQGIFPPLKRNEFSRTQTFYVTNSLRTAYEHPLHNHPNMDVVDVEHDTVSILCFSVPTAVLHGEKAPAGTGKNFSVRWFPAANGDWQNFCKYNWRVIVDGSYKECDIVTGPISMPPPKKGDDFGAVRVDGKYPQQIAFTTDAGRLWLARHLLYIIQEVRSESREGSEASVSQLLA